MTSHKLFYTLAIIFFVATQIFMISCLPQFTKLPQIPRPCEQWHIDTTANYITEKNVYNIEMPSGKLFITNDVGSITIGNSSNGKLHITNEKSAKTRSILTKTQLSINNTEQKTEIDIEYHLSSDTLTAYCNLTLLIPEHLEQLHINSEAADIKIDSLKANLNIFNQCGFIDVGQRVGDANILSAYGNIRINNQNGNVEIISNTGDVGFSGLIQSGNHYNISTTAGTIYFMPENAGGRISLFTNTGLIDLGNRVSLDNDIGHRIIPDEDTTFAPSYTSNLEKMQRRGEFSQIEIEYNEKEDRGNFGRNLDANSQSIMGRFGVGEASIILETVHGNIYIR